MDSSSYMDILNWCNFCNFMLCCIIPKIDILQLYMLDIKHTNECSNISSLFYWFENVFERDKYIKTNK